MIEWSIKNKAQKDPFAQHNKHMRACIHISMKASFWLTALPPGLSFVNLEQFQNYKIQWFYGWERNKSKYRGRWVDLKIVTVKKNLS